MAMKTGTTTGGDHRVTLLRDSFLDMPQLWMEVFIAGDRYEEAAFAEMFIRSKCTKAVTPEKADLVVFTGGEDVNPILYNEVRHHSTLFDSKRDEEDIKLYEICLNEGIPMLGVCRGAQFLHVMMGGKLYQDVDNHNGDHPMWDTKNKILIQKISSVHHQMVIPQDGMEILGASGKAKHRWLNDKVFDNESKMDVEAFFYRDICALGVQGHPEYKGYNHFMQWTLQQIEDYIGKNPDTEVRDRVRRLKEEFLLERNAKMEEDLKLKEMN